MTTDSKEDQYSRSRLVLAMLIVLHKMLMLITLLMLAKLFLRIC